jgi:group I intron endonuclease|nr:MAG TPA: intron associated endonuclease [Caudoviricetes sp.]
MKYKGFIYLTTNKVNGKKYVGQHTLGSEYWDNYYLGSGVLIIKAIAKYGRENFERRILRYCTTTHDLNMWEYVYIKLYKTQDHKFGYNIADGNVNSSDINPSKLPSSRLKNSTFHKNKRLTDETRRKISMAMKGRKRSKESIAKAIESKRKNGTLKHSIESRLRMSEAQRKRYIEHPEDKLILRRKMSEEAKRRLSASIRGVKRKPLSEETKRKIGASNSNRVYITDGESIKRIKIGEEIPKGFHITHHNKIKNK